MKMIAKTDPSSIIEFEKNIFKTETFTHRDHIKLAWLYLQNYSVTTVLCRFSNTVKKFAEQQNKENLYHETITWAYIFIIYERIIREDNNNWDQFVIENADIFERNSSIIQKYYDKETLQSNLAKKIFLMPTTIMKK